MSEYDLPVFLYGSCYMYLSIYYYKPEVARSILSFFNCIHSISLSYLYVYENKDTLTLESIKYWCIGYYIYDSVLSIINIYSNKSFENFGYLLHHIATIFILHYCNNVFCMNIFFEVECTNIFLFLGFYLKRTNNNNLIFNKFAHIIVYVYKRLYEGYYILMNLYNNIEYEYNLFTGGLFLYILCWAGLVVLLQETRDEIKRIYRKSQLDLCHQY
tara:strand:- start:51 stop:695 length:645 start_codon:yes stop_codon:yes gene_type:complete